MSVLSELHDRHPEARVFGVKSTGESGPTDLPLVSVYWISGYRGSSLIPLVEDFLRRTSWQNLELVVVDWSVGPDGIETRRQIQQCRYFHRVFFQGTRTCTYSNRNKAVQLCRGNYLIGLEDDVRLRRDISVHWLHDVLNTMRDGEFDDICLWAPNAKFPSTLASLSTRESAIRQTPRPSYPREFTSISESQRYANRAFKDKYLELGLRCRGLSMVETSMRIPSRNLVHQQNFTKISFSMVDRLVKSGAYQVRHPTVDWVDYREYQKLRKEGGLNFRVSQVPLMLRLILGTRRKSIAVIRSVRRRLKQQNS